MTEPESEICPAHKIVKSTGSTANRTSTNANDDTGRSLSEKNSGLGFPSNARLLDHIQAAVIALDMRGVVTDWNRHAEKLYGWTRDEALGRAATDLLVMPSDNELARSIVADLQANGSWEGEFTVQRKDGTTFPAHVVDTLIREEDEDGVSRPVAFVGVSVDVTERHRAEAALRASEERLQRVASATSDLVWDYDYTTGALWWSPTYYEKVGIPDGTPPTMELWLSRIHPDDAPRLLESLEEMARNGQERWVIEYRVRLSDGSYAYFQDRGSFCRGADGKPLRAVGAMLDISERKRIEEKLRRGQEQLQSILDNTPLVVNVKDLEGRYLLVNRWYEAFTHFPADQLIGKAGWEIFPAHIAQKHHEHDLLVARADQAMEFEEETPSLKGLRTYLATKFPLHDEYGKPYAVCTISADITERKKYERHLREHTQAQARLLYDLLQTQEAEQRRLAVEVHDGPLQSLGVTLLTVDRISRKLERGDQAAVSQELKVLRSSLAGIVSEVRAVLEDLSLEVLRSYGLGTALAGHLQHFSTATGIQVEFRNLVQGRLPSDTELLVYRLVQEALINVRKHADARAVTVHMRTDGGQVCVSVADDGKGFDARRVESMRPGKSTNGGGMRLGLRSMRQRVEAAGGEMTISSIPGKGTTLSFRCPLAPAQAPLPQPSQEVLEAIPC